ncbi:hypothetical protein D3C85_1776780 [compost metagenome]
MGPRLTQSALRCTALWVVLPVLRSGNTNTVARPATWLFGASCRATVSLAAASYCSGPSISSECCCSWASNVASRTFSTSSPLADSPLE